VVATNNPAIVLKEDDKFPNLVRDFRLAINPPQPPKLPEIRWTNDLKEGCRWAEEILRTQGSRDILTVDIESKGISQFAALAAIGFSGRGDKAVSFGERIVRNERFVRVYLRPILEHPNCRFLYHNGKFDVRNLRTKGIKARVDEDTLLLSYVCDERSDEDQVHSLDYLVMNELNWPRYEPPIVRKWKAAVGRLERDGRFKELEKLDVPDELYEYNALDAAGTAQIFPILEARAMADNVYDYYHDYLLPNSNAIIEVELRGANYDIHRAADINESEVLPELDRLREEMRLIVGNGNYNPNSSMQNAELVYDKWHIIHAIDRGEDKERSVDKAVYTEIKEGRFTLGYPVGAEQSSSQESSEAEQRSPDSKAFDGQDNEADGSIGSENRGLLRGILVGHEPSRESIRSETRATAIRWAERLARFKELDKQRSTYIEALIGRAEQSNGRIYTDFKFHSTVTGRSSSSGPNLQNITRAKEGLPNIRSLFVASEGCKILQADYSQAELRTIAYLSGNSNLGNIYRGTASLHKQVAERFYGKEYTHEQYVHAKNMDFGVAYGQGADTFQAKHDIPVKEGREFIEWWFAAFPEVKEWRQATAREVLANGFVQSPFGHKRRFHLVTFENKKAVIREAINFRPQNIAAQLTLYALRILVERELPVILTVHDSIVLDSPKTHIDIHARIVKEVMEQAAIDCLGWTDIPFEVDLQIGDNWGELEEYVA